MQGYRQKVIEALPVRRGQVVLDVGCGTGLCHGPLLDKVGPQGSVVGIEITGHGGGGPRTHRAGRLAQRHGRAVPGRGCADHADRDAALFCAVHEGKPQARATKVWNDVVVAPAWETRPGRAA